jgi:two-component system, NarL family, response regulator
MSASEVSPRSHCTSRFEGAQKDLKESNTMKGKRAAQSESPKIRIVIVDDHPIVREGILANVGSQKDMKIVGLGSDGVEALALAKDLSPDVLVLDLRMPGLDGVGVIEQLCLLNLPTKVIIMTTYDAERDVERSLKAGARGYLPKDSPRETILEAIRSVHAGGTYLTPRISQRILEVMRTPHLSRRELEVLQCLAKGKSDKEIGAELFITEGTVKSHVQSLLKTLGVAGRTAALREAVHRGLVEIA